MIQTIVDSKNENDTSVLVVLIAKNQEASYVRRVQTQVSSTVFSKLFLLVFVTRIWT